MPARIQWAPDGFASALAKVRGAMDLSAADLGRLAGISRSQASRWGHGAHQPAYANVRQLGIAVYREHQDLAQELMTSAGYPRLTDDDLAGEPERLIPTDQWEAGVLADPDLDEETKRDLITGSRDARDAYRKRRAERAARSRQAAAG